MIGCISYHNQNKTLRLTELINNIHLTMSFEYNGTAMVLLVENA